MFRKLKIWWIKRQARSVCIALHELTDGYDCGSDLIDHITGGRYSTLEARRKKLFDELSKLDPNFPKAK